MAGKDDKSDKKKSSFSSTLRNLADMGLSGEMADLQVIVEGKSFPCHRLILSAVSPHFRAMFNSGMVESQNGRLELPDITKEVFEIIRTFIYTGNVEVEKITEDNIVDLLQASALYELQTMQEECERVLGKEIGNDNCLPLFKMSRMYNCKLLFDKCRPFIMEGFNGLWKAEEFTTLHIEDLESIVRDDELVPVDEEQICEAIIMWVKKNPGERKKFIGRLFKHVRFINISPEYLITELYSEDLLTKDPDCKRYLDEARDFHLLPARQHEYSTGRFHLRDSDDYEEVILVLTEFDMERSGSFYQDGKCLWAFSLQQSRWFTLSPVPHPLNPGLHVGMVSYRTDVFITGGNETKTSKNIIRYDSEKNEFTAITEAVLKKGRFSHMMVAVRESLFVMGGKLEKARKDGTHQVVATIEELPVHGKRWRVIGELKTAVHSANTAIVGEKVFVFGGVLEDGSFHNRVQVFNVRQRETENACDIDKNMTQPFKVIHFGGRIVIFTAKGDMYDFDSDELKFKLMKQIKSTYLPIAAVSHYKGCIILLTGRQDNPMCYNKMYRMDVSVNPYRMDLITPKSSIKPKPIHSCQRGRVNKQFMYHTYFQ
ncbi:KLHL24_35 [Mytilus coruscus]|uniref:KLHL24_35 n=1 Tax=Mytilus coruscus TaxID=42192 RepID=A0A6J8AYS5_MYTCO|nr:KLHL24_35 [Mytilus coruscus]